MSKTKKQQLRSKADVLYFKVCLKDRCEICDKPAQQVHHFFPKGQFGHLRYNIDNGISLCMGCHFAHHHKGDPTIHAWIIYKRGHDWYQKLGDVSRETPASYQTINYYEKVINELNKYE